MCENALFYRYNFLAHLKENHAAEIEMVDDEKVMVEKYTEKKIQDESGDDSTVVTIELATPDDFWDVENVADDDNDEVEEVGLLQDNDDDPVFQVYITIVHYTVG